MWREKSEKNWIKDINLKEEKKKQWQGISQYAHMDKSNIDNHHSLWLRTKNSYCIM